MNGIDGKNMSWLVRKLRFARARIFEKMDYVKVTLAVLFIISVGFSGFFYYQLTRARSQLTQTQLSFEDFQVKYMDLYDSYLSLLNTTSSIEDHYYELQDMYFTIRSEYSNLGDRYSILLRAEAALRSEFEDIMNFGKSIVLEENRTLGLSAGGNVTLSYDTIYAGYVEVNFTSSTDVVIWVGSSVTDDEYYARFPPYPNTAVNGTFKIPVCATVYIYIINSNEETGAIVNLTMKYVY